MTVKPKVGKRYVRRDGKVTDPLIVNPCKNMPSHPFMDPNTQAIFTTSGNFWLAALSDADLISEYKPTKPEWRVVIKCESRAHARGVAAYFKDKVTNPKRITVEKSS